MGVATRRAGVSRWSMSTLPGAVGDDDVALTALSDGRFVAAWGAFIHGKRGESNVDEFRVQSSILDRTGSVWSPAQTVSSAVRIDYADAPEQEGDPRLVVTRAGEVLLGTCEGSGSALRLRQLTPTGWTPPLSIPGGCFAVTSGKNIVPVGSNVALVALRPRQGPSQPLSLITVAASPLRVVGAYPLNPSRNSDDEEFTTQLVAGPGGRAVVSWVSDRDSSRGRGDFGWVASSGPNAIGPWRKWFASDSTPQIRGLIRPYLGGSPALRTGVRDDRARTTGHAEREPSS